jgi:hypothetical protein
MSILALVISACLTVVTLVLNHRPKATVFALHGIVAQGPANYQSLQLEVLNKRKVPITVTGWGLRLPDRRILQLLRDHDHHPWKPTRLEHLEAAQIITRVSEVIQSVESAGLAAPLKVRPVAYTAHGTLLEGKEIQLEQIAPE